MRERFTGHSSWIRSTMTRRIQEEALLEKHRTLTAIPLAFVHSQDIDDKYTHFVQHVKQ